MTKKVHKWVTKLNFSDHIFKTTYCHVVSPFVQTVKYVHILWYCVVTMQTHIGGQILIRRSIENPTLFEMKESYENDG